jgi:hypothetical protein
MWHYVLPSAHSLTVRDGVESAAIRFVVSALRGSGLDRLAVREVYVYSAEQADVAPYDGDVVELEVAARMVTAAAADDRSAPNARLEGPVGQYVVTGQEGEIYLGLTVRQEAAEQDAREHGCEVVVEERPPVYLDLPGTALDPPWDDAGRQDLAGRLQAGPAFVLERWAFGRHGELGHFLTGREDIVRLSTSIRPRAGLAVFPAALVTPVDTVRRSLADPSGELSHAELRLVYRKDDRLHAALSFDYEWQLDAMLTGAPAGSEPKILVAPPFMAWAPPAVDAYVCADGDGVVRSRLGYHHQDPD